MEAVSYSMAREKKLRSVVLMSLEDYTAIQETVLNNMSKGNSNN